MKVNIQTPNFAAKDELLVFVESKLSKLEQFYDRIIFADVFLKLYNFSTEEILLYKPFLIILIIARMIYLLAGNSGAFMTMAGIEKKELLIQTIRGTLSILLALIFIEEYKLGAVVILIIFSMIFFDFFKYLTCSS